ncbi:con-Ins G1c-like [Stylophora pistillata]|uniref:Insulin n=1 Tax=Stylophora pistillata TaxID=50429 RepID=A0A2B4SEK5_STYPI|nr:con-Ins G1c-like [Stylophora pistillata]PFX28301.1 Insulin [Stylophora pistillata]
MMKDSFLWIIVPLLAIVLGLEAVPGSRFFKANEDGSRRIDGHVCGDHIIDVYYTLCFGEFAGKTKRRSPLMEEKKALSFIHSKSTGILRKARSATTIVEECCREGCTIGEFMEYC